MPRFERKDTAEGAALGGAGSAYLLNELLESQVEVEPLEEPSGERCPKFINDSEVIFEESSRFERTSSLRTANDQNRESLATMCF